MCQCCWKCKFVILKFVVWEFVSRIIVGQCEMVEKLKDNTFRISNFYFLSTWKYDTGETEN